MMENVPVKIAERYKPPPSIRQHSVQLNLNKYKSNYYSDSPEFQYDFQLERKVLATVPEWRRMRRLNVEARRERQEKRKLQRMRVFEEKQKQLLGAVSYPSAEDLSSSSLDSGDEEQVVAKQAQAQPTNQQEFSNRNNSSNGELAAETTAKQTANSFYNILQPTILTENNYKSIAANKCSTTTATESKLLHKSIVVGSGINNSSSFNYKDFEEDTSSPFDNIELKTINDLDILAQVLNNTQLQKNSDSVNNVVEATGGNADAVIPQEQIKNEQNSNEVLRSTPIDNSTTKPTVSQQQTPSIPMVEKIPEFNQFGYPFQQNQYYTKQNFFQKPITAMHYQHSHQINTNMNYVISTNCNGYDVDQPNHQNSNNQLSSPPQQLSHHTTTNNRANFNFCTLQRFENENAAKSKSVPDIIRELSQEVCNSEKRRNRNYSQNLDNDLNTTTTVMQNAVSVSPNQSSYLDLSPEIQKTVENISSMGFPLERVAKLIKKIGADDKKIIEHLIPLTELLDLGFDESKISEALFKYENNKEKALEYLIS